MIPNYINDWLTIIEQMQNDNTYKPCFGRALIECIVKDKYECKDDNVIINIDDVSECMISYYWNQIFFFNLRQSANSLKPPVISTIVSELIKTYKEIMAYKTNKSAIPVTFSNEVIKVIGKDVYKDSIKKCTKVIPQNVLYRFMNCNNGTKDLYTYDLKKQIIIFKDNDIKLIKEYGIIISKLLNYKWAQLLEKYNYSPKIVNKVQSIANNKIKRSNLTKYKEQLLKEFEDGHIIDFYTNEELDIKDVSIDHVLPWSFMYSDDIWNLVVTSKSNNSKKSNMPPSEDDIKKLKERNKNILNKVSPKYQNDLEEAIKESLVDKYFYYIKNE